MSTRHLIAAGRLPNRTDHLIAANRMIGEVCRKVRRRERMDRWAQTAMTGSAVLILPFVFWYAVILVVLGVFW